MHSDFSLNKENKSDEPTINNDDCCIDLVD